MKAKRDFLTPCDVEQTEYVLIYVKKPTRNKHKVKFPELMLIIKY